MDNQPLDNQNQTAPASSQSIPEESQKRRHSRRGRTWVGGAILIGLGLYFLAENFLSIRIDNWWAFFILIPAAGAFANAWNDYREAGGRLTRPVRGSILGGIVLTMVAVTFLLNLNWGLVGPLLLILAGLGLLFNVMVPGETGK